MSRRDALAFLKRIAENEDLRARIKAASANDIPDIARGMGFDITAEELKDVGKEIMGAYDELSDEILEFVVGGVSTQDIERWFYEQADTLKKIYDDIF